MAGLLWAENQQLWLEGIPKWLTGQVKETIPLTTSRELWGGGALSCPRQEGRRENQTSELPAGQPTKGGQKGPPRGCGGGLSNRGQLLPRGAESIVKGNSCKNGPLSEAGSSLKVSCSQTLLLANRLFSSTEAKQSGCLRGQMSTCPGQTIQASLQNDLA